MVCAQTMCEAALACQTALHPFCLMWLPHPEMFSGYHNPDPNDMHQQMDE